MYCFQSRRKNGSANRKPPRKLSSLSLPRRHEYSQLAAWDGDMLAWPELSGSLKPITQVGFSSLTSAANPLMPALPHCRGTKGKAPSKFEGGVLPQSCGEEM